jgi:hypothetical protein
MKTLVEIQVAIGQLPEAEVRQLAQWIQDYLDDSWDKQIKEDLASGKLDKLIAKAEADIATNHCIEIDRLFS